MHLFDRDHGGKAWIDPAGEEDDQGLEQIREGKEWKGGGRNGVKERLAWDHLLWAAKWLCTEKLFQVGEFSPFPV